MGVEVYWGSGSTPAWRVLLGFALKGVPYESRLLSFSAGDTRAPEFRALNPRGKVPTIKDGDFALGESLAILAWLDAKHPQTPIFGRTPEETGQVWRWCLEFENYASPALSALIRPLLFGDWAEKGDAIRAGVPAIHAELARVEAAVAGGALVGADLSAADIVWFCGLQYLVRAATRPHAAAFDLGILPLGDRYPNVLAWAKRIEAIPGYDATFPPHWRESDPPSPDRLS